MSDTSQQAVRGGFAKSSLDVILRMITQNVTPTIVGYFVARFPVINEATWFEITVFALAGVGTAINNFTPNHLIDSIVSGIIWIKSSWKKIRSAADNQP